MSVVSKTHASNRQRQKSAPAKGKGIRMLGSPRSLPAWLASLRHLQNRCEVVTGLLIVALLVAYGWSAYSQRSWQKAHTQLETLKKQERQLMQKNEELKNDLALQARQPEMGLVSPSPAEAIALERSSQIAKTPRSTPPAPAPSHHLTSLPLGY